MRNKKSLFIVLAIAVLALTLSVALVACGEKGQPEPAFLLASESEDGYATVYAPSDRDFRLMVLSDPQVDFFEKYKVVGSPGNDKTYEFIEDFVKETDPDLVIINGDLVMNDNFLVSSAPFFKRYAEIFEKLQKPWAFTFGNHDLDGRYENDSATMDSQHFQCSKEKLITYFNENYKYCLLNTDEKCEDGGGNYFVNVRKRSGELVYSLCLFDCQFDEENYTYSYVPTANQVSWYKDTINSLSDKEYGVNRNGKTVKSMIFNHVGIPEFKTAWDEAYNDGNVTEDYFYGHKFEGDYTNKYGDMPEDEQIFSVAKNLGSTTAIFMCHHHDNDFSVNYQGIRLTFGQHSGYSHNYRTTHKTHGNNGDDYKGWTGVSFKRVDDYGDQRGGTLVTIDVRGGFEITPVYAKDALSNFKEKYYIDYDSVAAALDANPDFAGPVARGENRAWKIG